MCTWVYMCDRLDFFWYVNFVRSFVPHAYNPVHFERSFVPRAYQTVRVIRPFVTHAHKPVHFERSFVPPTYIPVPVYPAIFMTRTQTVVTACAAVTVPARKVAKLGVSRFDCVHSTAVNCTDCTSLFICDIDWRTVLTSV